MSETEHQDAFITGLVDDLVAPVRTTAKVTRAPELDQVRKDHAKLMGVVRTFGEKVGGMIDKQRYEFMTAYEHHMQDIQNELQSLREKVAEISGDATRKSKLETLDSNQTKFKTEALHLDTETLAQRKQLRKLVNKLHSAERDRDWVFKRLKVAKRRYMELVALKQEAFQKLKGSYEASVDRGAATGISPLDTASAYYAKNISGHDDMSSVGSVGSHESDFSLQINTTRKLQQQGKSAADFKKDLQAVYGVHREHALLSALPHILPVSAQAASKNPHAQSAQALLRTQAHGMSQSKSTPALGQSKSQYKTLESSPTKAMLRKSREERDAIGELVALRARQEEIRDFVAQCASSCDKGPWAALPKRGIEALLQACRDVIRDSEQNDAAYNDNQADSGSGTAGDACEERRLLLAMELATVPEVYFIISDLLAGHDSVKAKEEAARSAAWSAAALSNSRANTEEFQLSTASTGALRTENALVKSWSAEGKGDIVNGDNMPINDTEGWQPECRVPGVLPDDDEGQQVQVSDWYDAGQPRTATGARSGPEALRGFYRTPIGSSEQSSPLDEPLDLIGGDDLGRWLLAGARQRQSEREKLQRMRASGGQDDEDFMAFD